MSNRSWFYASEGQQKGPFSEAQFQDLIVRGTVRADTLVWTEGRAGWQRAAEIPGLVPGGSGPPAFPQAGGSAVSAGGYGGGALSIDFGILEFTWRSIVLLFGLSFIITAPWALVWYVKWIVTCVQVPGRPNLSFTGNGMTVAGWFFGAVVLLICISLFGFQWLNTLMFFVLIAMNWLFLKWFVANIASNGQPLGLSFSGTYWAYLGWTIFAVLSVITIVGWAWVYVAWTGWVCRNIQGSRREAVFNGTGLEFLWRSIVIVLASSFVIPIPWMYRWKARWLASQTVLVERGAHASA